MKGPATLLYGSGTIGGAINVLDRRIPEQANGTVFQGAFEQRYNTVNEGKSSAFRLDGDMDRLSWHLEGLYPDSINQQIPGHAIKNDPDSASGRLQNSNTRASSGGAGFSLFSEQGFMGFSAHHLNNNYGIPPDQGGEQVHIDMQQTRYDMKAEINTPFPFSDKLRILLSYNDYQHKELEEDGNGNIFKNRGFLTRLDLMQKPWFLFTNGISGIQTQNSQFSAQGAEAIVPKSDIDTLAFFTLQDIDTENLTYELAMRIEQQWIRPQGHPKKSHTPINFSAAAIWNFMDENTMTVSFTHAQRAPGVQELFANGPHLATRSFVQGNRDLTEETTYILELGLHFDYEAVQADFSFYQNWAQNYISAFNSGRFFNPETEKIVDNCTIAGCLPVFHMQQRKANFLGYEAQVRFALFDSKYGQFSGRLFSDYTRGQFNNGEDIPRMPPLRYGAQLSWHHSSWQGNIRLTRAENQDKPGTHETPTAGYWLLNLSGEYKLNVGEQSKLTLFFLANNLLNEDIRHAVSYLRNFAPEPGRGVTLGIRMLF